MEKYNKIELFLKELRESYDGTYKVFTQGSCAKLFFILNTVFEDCKMYWSDEDGHAITKIKGKYYDIGGKLKPQYVKIKSYNKVKKKNLNGFKLLKFINDDECIGVITEKYV